MGRNAAVTAIVIYKNMNKNIIGMVMNSRI